MLGKLKIYLDCCCFNRPFDDASDDKVRLESEAIVTIIDRCEDGFWEICKSGALYDEFMEIQDKSKRQKVLSLYAAATSEIRLNDDIIERARELMTFNVKPYDALHVAYAEAANADVFLTTDKKLINAANWLNFKVVVYNPTIWIMGVL